MNAPACAISAGSKLIGRSTSAPISTSIASSRALTSSGTQSSLAHFSSRSSASELRSEEHTSELQSLMRISYAVFCLTKKKYDYNNYDNPNRTNDYLMHSSNPSI